MALDAIETIYNWECMYAEEMAQKKSQGDASSSAVATGTSENTTVRSGARTVTEPEMQ